MSLASCASFCLKYPVLPRNAKVGVLRWRKLVYNTHLRLLSSFGKSIGESMGKEQKVKKGVAKGIGANSDALEIQRIQDDVEKIDTMTVQELRTTLKGFGVPAKGLKRDLVSTLKCFLDSKGHDGKGDGTSYPRSATKAFESANCRIADATHVCSVDLNSPQNPNGFESVPSLKRKANADNISDENDAQDIDDTEGALAIQKSKSTVRKSSVENKTLTVNKETITRKRKLVTSTLEVSDQTEPWTIFAHKKPQQGWIAYNPRTMRPASVANDTRSMKLMSWNVNGLRALLKSESFSALQLAKREDFDVLCLQETKLQEKDVETIKQSLIEGYENSFWTCSVSKLGYSGTAIISRNKPISVKYGLGISDHDTEGRLVTAEFDSFYLISAYVPNSGDGLRRLPYRISEWDPSLSNYMKDLEKSKPVILTGDLNCAHQEIDIYNPAGNKRSAGFTEEERKSFETNFLSRGFVDTFRKQHPGVVGYTYWGYRHGGRKTNKGWRLDYFLVSESLADKVHDSYILPDVTGSDHSPIGLILKL